jgi:hypothetical protein
MSGGNGANRNARLVAHAGSSSRLWPLFIVLILASIGLGFIAGRSLLVDRSPAGWVPVVAPDTELPAQWEMDAQVTYAGASLGEVGAWYSLAFDDADMEIESGQEACGRDGLCFRTGGMVGDQWVTVHGVLLGEDTVWVIVLTRPAEGEE